MVVALVLVALGGGGFLWWRSQQEPPAPVAAAPPAPARPVFQPPATPDVAAPPAIQHPIEPPPARPARPLPDLAESDQYIERALAELLGKKPVASMLALDGFARRFVATVDNLGNERAQTQLWPVNPMAGNFLTETRGETRVVAPRNDARYAAFVRLAQGVDVERAAGLYRRLYPLFQQAYEELGYPNKYFNDRVVEVIDHLIATPEVAGPVRVKLVEVEGGTRPGGLYQFEDPALERLTAGQKILLRMGRENAEKLKARLRAVRPLIAR